jgi:hypothetical protein
MPIMLSIYLNYSLKHLVCVFKAMQSTLHWTVSMLQGGQNDRNWMEFVLATLKELQLATMNVVLAFVYTL